MGKGGCLKPVLFAIGPVSILSFGVVFALSLLISLFVMWRLYKNNLAFLRFRVTLDGFFDSVLVFFVAFGIGARLLHVFEHWEFFDTNILLWLLFLHFPGFSFLGGVIGGVLGLWLFSRAQKLPNLLLLDLLTLGLTLTLAFSRIGSFFGGDAFGKETSFFLKVAMGGLPGMRHPTQLYEAAGAFLLFGLLYYLYTKGKAQTGMIVVYFLLFLGATRFFIEMLRGDSVYLGGVAVAQMISAFFVLVAVAILSYTNRMRFTTWIKSRRRNV